MKSFFGGLGRKKENYTLVATVDEYSLVFVLLKNIQTQVAVERHGIHHSSSLSGTFLLDELISQLRGTFSIKRLVVSFAAPYFEIQASQQTVLRTSPKSEISIEEARLTRKKMAKFAERHVRRKIFEHSGILPDAFVMQKASVSRWKIDGYDVKSIEGFKGTEVEGFVLGTFLRQDYADFVEKLKRTHSINSISVVHPFEGVQAEHQAGVFVYLTEEKTQILSQHKEHSMFTESFSPGGNRFGDVLQKEFGMAENIAQELEDRYIQGPISEEVREKIYNVLLPEIYAFGTIVKEKLGSIQLSVAPHIFLFGMGVRFAELRQMFGSATETAILLPKALEVAQTMPKNLDTRYTPAFFLITAVYAQKTH